MVENRYVPLRVNCDFICQVTQQVGIRTLVGSAQGDYDGDGRIDYARLCRKSRGTGFLLMAYLTTQPDRPIELARYDGTSHWLFATRTIPPGEHKTHRFYGIGPGGPDSTAVVVTTTDSIHLCRIESEGMVYIWDKDKREFEAVGMY